MNITLREWAEADLDSLVKYADNINIAKWLTNAFPHPYTEADGRKYLSMVANNSPVKVFAIDIDGEAVGSIGFVLQLDIHEKNAELGYWLAEPFWRKGIMPCAIQKMIEYGFNTFDITRIFARPFSTNKASRRVLEKAGFTLEATLPKALFKYGEYIDELIYTIRRQ